MAAQLKDLELEQQALTWPEKAKAITIRDQETYNQAAGLLISIAALEKQIIDHHADPKRKAFESHRAICAAEKRLLDPLQDAKTVVKHSIGAWEQEQERIRRESERKALEQARIHEEEARLSLAVQAEQLGATEETKQEILNTPIPMPTLVAKPTFNRAAGLSTSQRWKAEVTDIKSLCRAVADGKASTELVQGNMTALNAMARAMKSTLNIPGVRAIPETGVTVR
jgi:hypothetical protein